MITMDHYSDSLLLYFFLFCSYRTLFYSVLLMFRRQCDARQLDTLRYFMQ